MGLLLQKMFYRIESRSCFLFLSKHLWIFFSWKTNPNETKNHLNIGRKTLFLTPERGTNFSFPVEHLIYILNKEPAKTIFQIQINPDDIITQLKDISKLRPEFKKRVKKPNYFTPLTLHIDFFLKDNLNSFFTNSKNARLFNIVK